ncbi:glycoside hydrolase domain-containing protein [Paractinoplanes globisporus]|uniref:Glycoside hydrolase domain-containing protein n=1 Tax=Paractinoplanes globisporus TaxID=113565 RepID=A0ABW6WVL9_9ACTN|nr:glycoside hydrolase domain-containing protein [Actinoplanes globisporus]
MGAAHSPRHASGAVILSPERRSLAIKASFLVLVLAASLFALARANAGAAAAYSTVQPGSFTGYAFDACTAPASSSMTAWRNDSAYRAIGVYIGGVSRGCTQANLTADWVQQQTTSGWKLLPLYVGPQASCTTMPHRIDNTQADAMGRAAASDAVTQAGALGLARGSVLIYDMESYNNTDSACRTGVLTFMNGWTQQLHELGYFSGYYSSVSSGIADQVANYSASGYVPPDYVDFARWNKTATLTDPNIPATAWPGKRRMKQYLGGHLETHGGVTINVDSNYVDYAPLPSAQRADFTGNGWSDLLIKNPSNGYLYVYPGSGTTLLSAKRVYIGSGWNTMTQIVRVGDLNRDGREDVVARQTNGDLYFYPGTNAGFGTRKKIGSGWNAMREIAGVGDLNKDGYPDLVAIQGGYLYFYPGKAGTALGTRKVLSTGWSAMTELTGVGDFNRDGYQDFVARDNFTGILYLYPGKAGAAYGTRISLGGGWMGLRDVVGVGDFDRDGYADVMTIRKSDNYMLLYRSNGKSMIGVKGMGYFGNFGPLA